MEKEKTVDDKDMAREKSSRPVIALMYDFDKTLCTKDMQEYAFIPSIGMSPKEFWSETNDLCIAAHMDPILAYMYLMKRKAMEKGTKFTREALESTGHDLEFFPGVKTWFDRINSFGDSLGVDVEHYIISSGLREIINGCEIKDCFKRVYACEFFYDENSVPTWPKNVVNYTTKTQFLFRINKGVLDISDDKSVNNYTPADERRVPFTNMIYIGDGLTDVPCMKLVKLNGGYSIAVYQNVEQVKGLLSANRVDFVIPADYSENSELEMTAKTIITKMATESQLRNKALGQQKGLLK